MSKYERTLTSQQLAEATLRTCFYTLDSQIYVNYGKILGINETIHLVLITPRLIGSSKMPYRHLTQDDINAIYASYKAIAESKYHIVVNPSGEIKAVPDDNSIDKSVFEVISILTDLTNRE